MGVSMSEANAIQAAFEDHVGVLYRQLVTNLGDSPITHKTDQQCLELFVTGLNLARKAKQMALAQIE
jgi:hypothetical protein